MTTIVDLSDEQLHDVCEATQTTDVALAIQTAAAEYVRYWKRQKLKEVPGTVELNDAWRDMDADELKERANVQDSR